MSIKAPKPDVSLANGTASDHDWSNHGSLQNPPTLSEAFVSVLRRSCTVVVVKSVLTCEKRACARLIGERQNHAQLAVL